MRSCKRMDACMDIWMDVRVDDYDALCLKLGTCSTLSEFNTVEAYSP